MKKLMLLALTLIGVTILMASHLTPMELNSDVELMYGGEFRTRAIMNNDVNEMDGGWFDNRFRFNLAVKLSDRLGITWNTEAGNIVWGKTPDGSDDFGIKNVNIETRELYLDYMMNWMDMKVRLGQQYWYDHRSLVLDDYFSGITADMSLAGIPTELGFVRYYEGEINKLDDAHVAFANFMFKMPVDWGITVMFDQCHSDQTADIWVIPYFMLNFDPLMIDLTAVIDDKMFKDELGEDDSEMGMAFAANVGIDAGMKFNLDFLYVDDKGINTLSSYYENGLYLFGNKLAYDGVQINSDFNWYDQSYMSVVGQVVYPMSEDLEIFGAIGMTQADEPIGMEINIGMNYKVYEKLMFCPVLAVGQPGKQWGDDIDGNTLYMLGGLLKANF